MAQNNPNPAADTVRARFAIVTPMFLGGARQEAESIRPPSVKGALRFWWRALNWGRMRGEVEEAAKEGKLPPDVSREVETLRRLHKKEAHLFGVAANPEDKQQAGGQGVFLLTTDYDPPGPEDLFSGRDIPKISGKAYLAGMGLGQRQALPVKRTFGVRLIFRPACLEGERKSIEEALRLFGLVGGLGSRSRRGYGSVVKLVEQDNKWRFPTEEEFEREKIWLKKVIAAAPKVTAPFSAITHDAGWFRGAQYDSADDAMETMGSVFNEFRTNGTSVIRNRDGTERRRASPGKRIVNGSNVSEGSLRFFATDHYHVHAVATAGKVKPPHDAPPERSVFGLPHPYKFSSLWHRPGEKVSYDFAPSWDSDGEQNHAKGRRASPLFMHIAAYTKNGRTRYQPLCLLLPADFLPVNGQIQVSVDGNFAASVLPPSSYQVIREFLAQCATAEI